MTTKQRFDEKGPSELRVLAFDFTADLATGETLSGSPTVVVTLLLGNDSSPASILAGANSLDGSAKVFYVPVHGGMDGCDYDVVVKYPTTNSKKSLELGGILPVRAQ